MDPKSLLSLFLCVILSIPSSNTKILNINSVLINQNLLGKPSSSVFITMTNGTSAILELFKFLSFKSDSAKAFVMMEALQSHADLTQAPVQAFLSLAGVDFTSFWISNQIHILDAFPALLLELLTLFSGNIIASIEPEIVLPMLAVLDEGEGVKPQVAGQEWGLQMMNAPSAWDNNMLGQGCRVMVLDTGVRASHEQFAGRNILWKDAIADTSEPNDLNGHGSHVCGTIAGKTVGMAPQSILSVCKCCDTAGCTQDALLGCGQWACCPNPPSCTQKPHVVSCSWGGSGGNPFYQSTINAWHAANICPVFALGNSGPGCSTAGSPGDYKNVLGVGAIDQNKTIASFSSRGPASTGSTTKPQVSAPGVAINSCSHLTDDGYRKLSGTSMACPHMSGMAAVLQSNGNIMSYDKLVSTVTTSCSKDVKSAGTVCGGKSDTSFPNFVYGHGRANCATAVTNMKIEQQQIEDADTDSIEDFDTEDTEEENNAAEDFETDDD